MDLTEVGEDDGAAAAAVDAVDLQGFAEVAGGAVEVAEAGEDHPGVVGPAADAEVRGPGFAGGRVGVLLDRGLGGGEGPGGEAVVAVEGGGVREGGLVVRDRARVVQGLRGVDAAFGEAQRHGAVLRPEVDRLNGQSP